LVFCVVFIPIFWAGGKIEERFKGKKLCPFGTVEFIEKRIQ